MRMGRVWAIAAILLPIVVVLRETIEPHDVYWHLAYGRAIWETKTIPATDTFSFTRSGEPFFDQPWLAQLCMLGVHGIGGMRALVLFQALIASGAMAFIVLAAYEKTSDDGAAGRAALLVALPTAMNNLGIRPQSIALVLFGASVWVLTTKKRTWLLPLIMIAWVNIHGSFVLLLVLAGFHVLMDRSRRFAIVLAATCVATLLNPHGPGVYKYVAGLASHTSMSRVEEWSGTSLIAVAAAIAIAALLAFSKNRPPAGELVVLTAFLGFGMLAPRNAIWGGLVAAPMVAPTLKEKLAFDSSSRSPIGLAACVLGALAIVFLATRPLKIADTPIAAVEALRALPNRPARLLSTEGTASYLMWAAPEQKTFVDTRIELFPPELWDDWAAMMNGDGALIDRWGIDGILVEMRHENVRDFATRTHWKSVHQDEQFVLFVRQ